MIITAEQALKLVVQAGPNTDDYMKEIEMAIIEAAGNKRLRSVSYHFKKDTPKEIKDSVIANISLNKFKVELSARQSFIVITW